MNENLQNTINEALKALLASVQQGAGFVQEQLPTVVQQKLMFDFWECLAEIGFAIIFMVGSIYWVRLCIKMDKASGAYDSLWEAAGYVPTVVVWGLGLISIPLNVMTAIKILVAPNLYILEWLRGMVR
jgi:hypothetical protein